MADKTAAPNLEESLAKISTLVERMEQSDLTLEESLNNFEEGIKLVKHCQQVLTSAEQKVQMLIQNQQGDNLVPFASDTLDENNAVDA